MKTDWLRKEDESEYAYIYRIGNIKEQIGSWQDVADLLNYQLGYQYTGEQVPQGLCGILQTL